MSGLFFAVQSGNQVKVTGNGAVNGTVVGNSITISGNGEIAQ